MLVLDASVIMAFVLREPGNAVVQTRRAGRFISSVNLAEARSRLIDRGVSAGAMNEAIALLDASVVPFSEADAIATADLRQATKPLGLSIGDRACLALAQRLGAVAVTADRMWAKLDLPVEVEVIR